MKKMTSWAGRNARTLRSADVEALIGGKIAFIRIPGFLASDWCSEVARRFFGGPMEEHDYGLTKVRQLGLAVGPMFRDRKPYFDRAPELAPALRAVYRGGEDPLLKLHLQISAWAGWERVDALEEGRPYLTDMIGALLPGSCVPIHCESPLEMQGVSVSRSPHILSWNVYLSASERGGRLIVYRRPFRKGDESYRLASGGFDPAAVGGVERAAYAPELGDLVMFNSANFHEVEATQGPTSRTTAHSYVSVDPARKRLAFWS